MKTICPYCGQTYKLKKEFIGKRANCKKCQHKFNIQEYRGLGNPANIKKTAPPKPPHPDQSVSPSAKNKKRNIAVAGIAVTVILVAALVINSQFGHLFDKTGNVDSAWAHMQVLVGKRLKSKNAKFPPDGLRHVNDLGGGRYQVNSYTDAQNAQGVEMRTYFVGVIKKANQEWELESLTIKK